MGKQRRSFTAQQKMDILKQHILEKKSVSDLCDEHGIHPTIFYRWQQTFFSNAVSVFEQKKDKQDTKLARKVTELEDKLARKNEVLSELMEEHIALKKSLGEG